jgi:hypothetical protein
MRIRSAGNVLQYGRVSFAKFGAYKACMEIKDMNNEIRTKDICLMFQEKEDPASYLILIMGGKVAKIYKVKFEK